MTSSKYMVSQHFGRVAASVTLNVLEKTGLVHLLAKGPKALDIEFHFSVDDVLTFTGQAGDIVDFAIRNAMSHVSRLARNNPVFPKHSDEVGWMPHIRRNRTSVNWKLAWEYAMNQRKMNTTYRGWNITIFCIETCGSESATSQRFQFTASGRAVLAANTSCAQWSDCRPQQIALRGSGFATALSCARVLQSEMNSLLDSLRTSVPESKRFDVI